MKKMIVLALIVASASFAQNLVTMQAVYNGVKAHSMYQSTYALTIPSQSNAAILLSCGGSPVLYGVSVDFTASTLTSTDIDIKLYRAPYWTNGVVPTTSPIWQAPYAAAATLVSGVCDPMDLNQQTPASLLPQPIGTWAKVMSDASYANYWAGMSNIGNASQNVYMVASSVRQTVYMPAPYMIAPMKQNVLIINNKTAAASNAVLRVVIDSYIPR